MLMLLFDILMILLIGISWAGAVIIVGWPFRKYLPRLDDLKFDLALLVLLFLLQPLWRDNEFFSYLQELIYLPIAAAALYYVHRD